MNGDAIILVKRAVSVIDDINMLSPVYHVGRIVEK